MISKLCGLLIIAVASTAAVVHNDGPPCAAIDENSTDILEDYRWSDTTSDTATVSWRQRVSLPVVPVNQILIVTDTAVCRRAVSIYNAALADSGDVRQSVVATVIKWGPTRFAISDTTHNAGEWTLHMVVDSSFSQVLGITRQ
jgi:hypothetical protein